MVGPQQLSASLIFVLLLDWLPIFLDNKTLYMIFYGWSSRVLKEAPIDHLSCPHCSANPLNAKVRAAYLHLFWIPIIPFRKFGRFECNECQNIVTDQRWSTFMRRLQKSVKVPYYMFTGLMLGIVFVAYMIAAFLVDKNREASLLASPASGDIYTIMDKEESSEFRYYLWKAEEVFEDSMYVTQNVYFYNMVPEMMVEDDGFIDLQYVVDLEDLQQLYEDGELVQIRREYTEFSGFDRMIHAQLDTSALWY